ncbi:hypothetical protein MO867_16340 [Microbulbifer sp. OS29]|uniref:Uncharacterized protein n=1 Tax=Microbulbifer okhotskensis TaxID=2926617 RepID=A0A9X2EQG5_9GAMM|nr:hypothetical protein [Microbulbifer okhotskensis]MCO1335905.1 hypothetical protein [Microbulbifer okhotskensis]
MCRLPFLRFSNQTGVESLAVVVMPMTLYTIAGVSSALALVGILLLYSAWCRSGSQPLRVWSGWGALVLSAFGWSSVVGVEYGVSIATLIVMLGVFVLLSLKGNWPIGPRAAEKQRSGSAPEPQALRQLWLRGLLRFMAAFLLPTASGLIAGLLFFGFTGFSDTVRLVGGAFLSVTVWTLAMVWCCADKKLLRPSAALLAFSVLSGLLLMFTVPATAA